MATVLGKKKTVRIASGRKRARQDVKLNAANTALRSKFRTVVKNVQKAVAAGEKDKASELYKSAQSVLTKDQGSPIAGHAVTPKGRGGAADRKPRRRPHPRANAAWPCRRPREPAARGHSSFPVLHSSFPLTQPRRFQRKRPATW